MTNHSRTLIITAQHGIHTRPGALFVKLAKEFNADIRLKCSGKEANAKSLFKLLTLPLINGASVEIIATGDDSKQAIDTLSTFLRELS